jgi:hypothetical protein
MKAITCCWTGEKDTVNKIPPWFTNNKYGQTPTTQDVSWE